MLAGRSIHFGSLAVLIALLAACSSAKPATPTPAFAPNSPEGRGFALFSGKGRCATCHSLSPDTVIVGPSLAGIAASAGTREPGMSAADYIEESILSPDQFKVPGFEKVQMDMTLAKTLTYDEISEIVAYLLTLK
jgi:cytochrome c551/c552